MSLNFCCEELKKLFNNEEKKGRFCMNYLQNMFDGYIEKRLNARFQKLVASGLYARDVVAVKLRNEERERLALLCVCKKQVYVVVSVNNKKANSLSYFEMLGHNVQSKKGIILEKKNNWIELHGSYEGYKAPLIVAQDVEINSLPLR